MTNQEAINDLKVILSEITECEESICYITDVDAEPLRLAIKALERQIPKKPISYDSVPHNRCPVCNNSFNMKVVKTYAPRISSKDSDFLIRYQNINPLLYEVWVCPFCGYAALKSKFPKLKSYEKNLIILKICNQWKGNI